MKNCIKKKKRQELMNENEESRIKGQHGPRKCGYVLGNEGKVDQISCEITGIP